MSDKKLVVSDCCGAEVKIIEVTVGKTKYIPETWGKICSECNKPCTPIEKKPKEKSNA